MHAHSRPNRIQNWHRTGQVESPTKSGLRGHGGTADAGRRPVRQRCLPGRHRPGIGCLAPDRVRLAREVGSRREASAEAHRAAGRPPKVSEADLAKVERALQKGPKANGFPTELWTLARVADVIETGDGSEVSPRPRLAGAAPDGLEPPASGPPGHRAGRRSHRAVGQRTLAQGKKNARAREAWIVFQDESGFSLLPGESTWAPRGQTPVLRHHFNNWKRLSMSAGSVLPARGTEAALVFGMQPGSYNDRSIMEFLLDLHRHLDGDKVTLIWDGSRPTAAGPCRHSSRASATGWWSSAFRPTPTTSTRSNRSGAT